MEMKNISLIVSMLFIISINQALPSVYYQDTDTTYLLQGRVLGGDSNKPLPNASISVEHSNVSSVTNQDGYFAIRVSVSVKNSRLVFRHLGYNNLSIPIITLIDKPNYHIIMNAKSIELEEVEVIAGDGQEIVRKALHRIPENYPQSPNMMVAFYREHIKKRNNYISLVEAVLDIHKKSYRSYSDDQAKIYIGRKATDVSATDTILLKFQGGISNALLLDVAKNPEIVFGKEGEHYTFTILGMININNKPHYNIAFAPRENITDILFRGNMFIDASSYAFSRIEFNMNVEKRKDAAKIFIRRKPSKMRVAMTHASYMVNYLEKDGKWYFNYSKTDVGFKVRWTNRFFGLFSTHYTIGSEIAITDRYIQPMVKFPRRERIHSTDVIAEKVEYFQDPDFWGQYNVIQPDDEINNAIRKLSDKLKRRPLIEE